jgi:SAM-dependent methyltransferase
MRSGTTTDGLLDPARPLRPAGDGVLSGSAAGDDGAPYDRHAALYDRLVGSPLYNRVIWGTRTADYTAFAAEALAAGDGPFLDAGCGTAVFTAAAYRETARPLVLVDRSLGMLARAAERLGDDASATLVQADLHDLPFTPGAFATVGCFAMLHVLDDPWAALAALREHVAPGGRLFASMLVTDRGGTSGPYLTALRRRGEVGPLRTADELAATARELFGDGAQVTRSGSMAWLRATRADAPPAPPAPA